MESHRKSLLEGLSRQGNSWEVLGLWHQIIRTAFCWICSQVQFVLIGLSGPWRVSHSPPGAQDFPRSRTKSPVTQEPPPPSWGNQTSFTLRLGKQVAPSEAKHLENHLPFYGAGRTPRLQGPRIPLYLELVIWVSYSPERVSLALKYLFIGP